MKIGAILQARMASTRLPGKVLLKLPVDGQKTLLEHSVYRASITTRVDEVIVATSDNPQDDPIAELFPNQVFRGDEDHVLGRFYHAAKEHDLDYIFRLTGDNPCLDPETIDRQVQEIVDHDLDMVLSRGLPLGTNGEVFTFEALQRSFESARDPAEIEHVTPYIRNRPEVFKIRFVDFDLPRSVQKLRLTIDYPSDYGLLNLIFTALGENFTMADLKPLCERFGWLAEVNPNYQKLVYKTREQELHAALQVLQRLELDEAAREIQQALESSANNKKN